PWSEWLEAWGGIALWRRRGMIEVARRPSKGGALAAGAAAGAEFARDTREIKGRTPRDAQAGSGQLEDERAESRRHRARRDSGGAGGEGAAALRHCHLPARDLAALACDRAVAKRDRARRPGLPCRAARRAHRRDQRADAKDAGCSFVILGHSERRADQGES